MGSNDLVKRNLKHFNKFTKNLKNLDKILGKKTSINFKDLRPVCVEDQTRTYFETNSVGLILKLAQYNRYYYSQFQFALFALDDTVTMKNIFDLSL